WKARQTQSLAEAEALEGPEADVPEPPLDDDAVEAPVVELDQPLRLHDEALVDVVDLEIPRAAGREGAQLVVDDQRQVGGDLGSVPVRAAPRDLGGACHPGPPSDL